MSTPPNLQGAAPEPVPTDGRDTARALEDVVEPVIETMGFSLCHIEWAGQSRRRILRVYLDHERGVTLDDCAKMNRILGNALDAAELAPDAGMLAKLLGAPYVLEVSSPGLERPLSKRSHFEQFLGRKVTVRTHEPLIEGSKQRTFHGQIEAIQPDPRRPDDDREGLLLIRDDEKTTHEIGLSRIRRANLVYEG